MIGGVIDVRRLFKDLALRKDNPLDDGWVKDHVSLVDVATFGDDENNDKDTGVHHVKKIKSNNQRTKKRNFVVKMLKSVPNK